MKRKLHRTTTSMCRVCDNCDQIVRPDSKKCPRCTSVFVDPKKPCRNALRYKGVRAPRCYGPNLSCDACDKIYARNHP